jgi:prepilin-type N-terminal cleavage/methylation domain-containing protein
MYSRLMNRRSMHGFTLVELMVALFITLLASSAVVSLGITGGRLYKSIYSQQICLRMAKSALEGPHGLNREIRMANSMSVSADGYSVVYTVSGDATARKIALTSTDSDYTTPWNNTLTYTYGANTPIVVAKWLAPQQDGSAFFSTTTGTLQMKARIGDRCPTTAAYQAVDNAYSGPGIQGVEIYTTVSPRNTSE